ncbi:MAG: amino acid racemase [Deinococcota bacterium]|jgi:aspartate racemase|nr:amino acid racemase [Deinococcota bacterium]
MRSVGVKTVGVLGGLGPEATLDFFAKVLKRTGAGSDQEHLRLIIDNNPQVPNRNEAVAGRGPSPAPQLAAMARGLERAGADFLVMVCNSAHAYEQAILEAVAIPFLSLIELTRDEVVQKHPGVRTVGLLAAAGCLDAGLYQRAFAGAGIRVLVLTGAERESFMTLLYRVKAGDTGAATRAEMRALARTLALRGAEVMVAGCTEVPLVLGDGDLAVPLVDSTDVLVDRTIAYAREPLAEPG